MRKIQKWKNNNKISKMLYFEYIDKEYPPPNRVHEWKNE